MRSEDLSRWTSTHFNELDSNRDGFINNGEIETAMQNPCYSGRDAQALVALHRQQGQIEELSNDEWGYENDGITRSDATELGRQATSLRNEINQDANTANYGTEHFGTLDADHNGYINDTEISRALNDSALPAQDRAALEHMRDQYQQIERAHNDEFGRENSGISRGDLHDHWNRDSHRTINAIDGDLIESAETINHSNPNLYGNSANPLESIRPEAVRQGAVGDCQMLAPLAGLARSNPQAIRDMIQDNHNGTYTVTFPGDRQHPVTVNAPTQAELSEYARGNEHGTWAAVIEKAAGARRTTDGSPQHGAHMTENQAYELLTGRRAATHDLSDVSDQDLQRRMANCHNQPISAITNHEIDGADQRHDETNIPMGHEYTITNYDPQSRTVTLRNPWGNGEPTDSNGNPRDGNDDGQFTMSYDEFRRTFDSVEYAN
jgi:Ca2+-binding EF-hand superfamily protein